MIAKPSPVGCGVSRKRGQGARALSERQREVIPWRLGKRIPHNSGSRRRIENNPLVEGAEPGSMVCLCRGLARLDVGCVRLHRFPAHHAPDRAGVWCVDDGCDVCFHDYALDAAGGRNCFRLDWRSDRPQKAFDDRDLGLLALQFRRRLLAYLHVSIHGTSNPRIVHGRRMAGRLRACDGNLAHTVTGAHERSAARFLGPRFSAVVRDLRTVLQFNRLARHAVGRGVASSRGALCALLRQGTGGLDRKPSQPARTTTRGQSAAGSESSSAG